MFAIMFESVLFVAALAALAALVFLGLRTYTPLGLRMRQLENRRRIEGEAEGDCHVHGHHEQHELVRLRNGDKICPDCFREAARDTPL